MLVRSLVRWRSLASSRCNYGQQGTNSNPIPCDAVNGQTEADDWSIVVRGMRQPWLTRQAAEGGGPDERALMGSADRQPTHKGPVQVERAKVTTLQLCYPQALSIPMQCPEERERRGVAIPQGSNCLESIKSVCGDGYRHKDASSF
ncbi:hypothetical protein V8C34DRAFT_206706 [Trichoderma compactum]